MITHKLTPKQIRMIEQVLLYDSPFMSDISYLFPLSTFDDFWAIFPGQQSETNKEYIEAVVTNLLIILEVGEI